MSSRFSETAVRRAFAVDHFVCLGWFYTGRVKNHTKGLSHVNISLWALAEGQLVFTVQQKKVMKRLTQSQNRLIIIIIS